MDFSTMVLTMYVATEDGPDVDERILGIAIEQSLLAAELGFNPWFTEHHFRGPWHSNPIQFASFIAPQMPRDRYLGFGGSRANRVKRKDDHHVQDRDPLAIDFAAARAHSIKRWVAGLKVRFFRVTKANGHRSIANSIGSIFRERRLHRASVYPGSIATKPSLAIK